MCSWLIAMPQAPNHLMSSPGVVSVPATLACYPLGMTHIAMENGPFIDGLLKMVIFHGYVK